MSYSNVGVKTTGQAESSILSQHFGQLLKSSRKEQQNQGSQVEFKSINNQS